MTSFNPKSGRPFKNNNRQFTRQQHDSNTKRRNRHSQYDHAPAHHHSNHESQESLHQYSTPTPHQGFDRSYSDYNEYHQRPNSEYGSALDLEQHLEFAPEYEQTHDHSLTQNLVSRAVAKALNSFDPLDDLNNSIDAHANFKPRLSEAHAQERIVTNQHPSDRTDRTDNTNRANRTDRADHTDRNSTHRSERAERSSSHEMALATERQPRHNQQKQQAQFNPQPQPLKSSRAVLYHPWENSPQDPPQPSSDKAQATAPAPTSRKNPPQGKGHNQGDFTSKNQATQEPQTAPKKRQGSNAHKRGTTSQPHKQSPQPQPYTPREPRNTREQSALREQHEQHEQRELREPRAQQRLASAPTPKTRETRVPRESQEIREPRKPRENTAPQAFAAKAERKLNNNKQPQHKSAAIAKALGNNYSSRVQEHDPRHLDYLVLSNYGESENSTEPLVQTIISHQYQARENYQPQSHLRTQLISVHTAKGTVRAQPEKHIRRRPSNRRPYHP